MVVVIGSSLAPRKVRSLKIIQPCSLNEVMCGEQVKVGVLKSNKAYTLYEHPSGSAVISLAAAADGQAIVSGHADGAVFTFRFEDGAGAPLHSKLAQHSCAPFALAWGTAVVAAGADCKVCTAVLNITLSSVLKPHSTTAEFVVKVPRCGLAGSSVCGAKSFERSKTLPTTDTSGSRLCSFG